MEKLKQYLNNNKCALIIIVFIIIILSEEKRIHKDTMKCVREQIQLTRNYIAMSSERGAVDYDSLLIDNLNTCENLLNSSDY